MALVYDNFKKLGVELYAISADSEFVHKAWYDASETIKMVKFPMLSDRALKLSTQFDVLMDGQGLPQRATFVINPNKEVAMYEISAGGIGRNAKELLRKVYAAQHLEKNPTQACPSSWQPGEDTLTPDLSLVGKL